MSEEKAYDEFDHVVGMNVHQRIAKAMATLKYVQKDKPQGLKYSIVSHDKVTAAVRPVLLSVGVIYYPVEMTHSQDGNRTEVRLNVRFVNIDRPDDCIDVPALGYGVDAQDKGPGKAVSYAVKYALLKALGLETGDDPDLDQKTDHVVKDEPQLAPDGSPVPTFAYAMKACEGSIEVIKGGITAGDLSVASEAWQELTAGEKMALWVAPSKNGPFTTKERETIKSSEFREAHEVAQ
jgi:hypothetical protein